MNQASLSLLDEAIGEVGKLLPPGSYTTGDMIEVHKRYVAVLTDMKKRV